LWLDVELAFSGLWHSDRRFYMDCVGVYCTDLTSEKSEVKILFFECMCLTRLHSF
jgi:hypothetical protein